MCKTPCNSAPIPEFEFELKDFEQEELEDFEQKDLELNGNELSISLL